ncbi:acyl-CoA dehydrogenase [Motilimonas cestriensis]|uniref:Acyl-coenzyme A dehydrogenase n=1 Tax=Motilimonas cestriensis TaxID=2742685 RepID=A0ABS8WBV1_9GAMM|nr:acyl-CoA dehydrogenase [Motilimonas cestriensis]MCE2595733.1 acyl-CoA dehydrogenase [Motilimonas cestriensis]
MEILLLLFICLVIIFAVTPVRRVLISGPIFGYFKQILPPLSATEQEAMKAGSVWWDGELFAGKPDWQRLHGYTQAKLTEQEQSFIDNQVNTLLAMVDDYKIVQQDHKLPEAVWQYLRKEGFFALIIDPEFGGKGFSALANSTIVSKIASRSLSVAVTVMVPNSLGPGELLSHYGTTEQKEYWLPRLAKGEEVPCFALTGPNAGSDAGSIPDKGIICYGDYQGERVLGISLTWDKRYITLAPVASVLGLAFKLFDPDGLIGETKALGITCALIPTAHPGVIIGQRHYPMGLAFQNGTTQGNDVFIPMDWIIGGQQYAGKGWRMLVECLSAGRGISLPALGAACGHLSTRMTGAYALVRHQFGLPIGKFEGVQGNMARIGAFTYQLEAARTLTTTALDMGQRPAIVTAIAKYHMTEMGRTLLSDAMDIHAGKAIQLGPQNYLGHAYLGIPIAITVEGANILTRSLMIFGQGATRCHPYVLSELAAAAEPDPQVGLAKFDQVLIKHIGFAISNSLMGAWQGLTAGKLIGVPVSNEMATYYRQLTRMSRALALTADVSMLVLGGDLKRKEMISARLGDVLSHLYLASASLKWFHDRGSPDSDASFVHYNIQYNLYQIGQAFDGFFDNFSQPWISRILKTVLFPWGINYRLPSDQLAQEICQTMMTDCELRDAITHLCYIGDGENDATGIVERSFKARLAALDAERKLVRAIKDKTIVGETMVEKIEQGLKLGIINAHERTLLLTSLALTDKAVAVDVFDKL